MQQSGERGHGKTRKEAENREPRRALDFGRVAAPKDNWHGREREQYRGPDEGHSARGAGETQNQRAKGKARRETARVKPQHEPALPRRGDGVDPIFAGNEERGKGAAEGRANANP